MTAQINDSDFLPKDLFMAEKPQIPDPPPTKVSVNDYFCFPDEFPYDYDSSGLGSPGDSITETEESDVEDPESYNNMLAAALTKTMARSFIINQDDITQKSTRNVAEDCRDLLFQKSRRKIVGVAAVTPNPHHINNASPVTTGVYYPNPALTHRQMQVNQFHELKQQQMLRLRQQCSVAWGRHNRERRVVGYVNNHNHNLVTNGRPLGISSSTWPPLQPPRHTQQQSSGMRAVFLGAPNPGKPTCGGTGVFLPRGVGVPNDVPKKPACSTVLLPARVVQALNLNLEDLGPPGRFPVTFVLNHDKGMSRNSSNLNTMSPKKSLRRQSHPTAINTHYELRLPQEWSY
ncbi:hypothetical protein ZOSMA_162G00260 [Zostera marina]|uniref:Uncharacterized protein n=1 Tax=Zostera marina TaxID=29655 RepID=A0A0K9PW81_ZOSMR|nr:hypothetical protein ZOSMA_162G00260 [Zostera marina]